MGTELVTLSVCQNGLGDVQSGESARCLPFVLTVAGVGVNLLSLWKQVLAATADFMGEDNGPLEASHSPSISRPLESPPNRWNEKRTSAGNALHLRLPTMTNTFAKVAAASFAALALTAPVSANQLYAGDLCNQDYSKIGGVTYTPNGDPATNGEIRTTRNCDGYIRSKRQQESEVNRLTQLGLYLQLVPQIPHVLGAIGEILRGNQRQPMPQPTEASSYRKAPQPQLQPATQPVTNGSDQPIPYAQGPLLSQY